MTKPIRRVGVIGAGVMGSGIAAHLANAGVECLMLDIVPPNLSDKEQGDRDARNRFALKGLETARKARPAAFMHPSHARLVSVGNLTDDLSRMKDVDLVIEVIPERMDLKRDLFAKLEAILPKGAIVASNTSGLRIAEMMQGRSEAFRRNFLVMHFFNPVRYMKLLELVAGPDTDPAVFAHVRAFGEDVLGKGIVVAKDTPNFVGNRIGTHAMMLAIQHMLKDGLAPEDVDAITGAPMGHPKSASFRTADLVGVDTLVHVAENCYQSLTSDEDREVFKTPDYIRAMVEKKILGDKTKGGFYRKGPSGDIETLDPATLSYRAKGGAEEIRKATKAIGKEEDPGKRLKLLLADKGKTGAFAWKVMSQSFLYAARRMGEITDSVEEVDHAMRWGYNWELGPFESWDALGFAEIVDRMRAEGMNLPATVLRMREAGASGFYKGDEIFDLARGAYVPRAMDPRNKTLPQLRVGPKPVLSNDGAEAWDLGDGVLGLTFKTKANSIDPDVISMIPQAVTRAEQDFRAMVIANEGEHFCVGANLFLVLVSATNGDWEPIRQMVHGYQQATQRLKYSKVPVVAAPFGMTLGGGLELCLGCSSVQAAAETYAGLVEVGVGLLPGGAGNLNLLWRALENIPEGVTSSAVTFEYVAQVFKNIALASVATSAEQGKALGYFRRTDGVSFDRARQLTEAKAHALGLAASGYHPPTPKAYRLPGESGIATLSMMVDTLQAGGYASAHDALIARKVATVLCGGASGASKEVTEDEVLELEREAFVSLCGEELSRARMQYMLQHNKPLRN